MFREKDNELKERIEWLKQETVRIVDEEIINEKDKTKSLKAIEKVEELVREYKEVTKQRVILLLQTICNAIQNTEGGQIWSKMYDLSRKKGWKTTTEEWFSILGLDGLSTDQEQILKEVGKYLYKIFKLRKQKYHDYLVKSGKRKGCAGGVCRR
jgi:hypothetical protein